MDDYERILLVKPEVFIYKIPPRTTSRGYRASDWKLDQPDWTGRLRLVAKDKECILKLEDKTSGELFAKCPIDKYPGISVEPVLDSSRYFVIRLKDDERTAFIGIGFADRGDSFDLNVALQDHFKWLQKSEELEQEAEQSSSKPQLDLSLKEGQTITINMNIAKKSGGSSSKTRGANKASGSGLLPPPPGSHRMAAASSTAAANSVSPEVQDSSTASNSQLLLDLGSLTLDSNASTTGAAPTTDSWGEFTTAKPSTGFTAPSENTQAQQPANWVNF